MDFGLGFIQHPSPVLEFQGGLLRVSEEFSQEEPNQRKTLSMGVVIGIICCSEPTMMPVSLAVSALPKGGTGADLCPTGPHLASPTSEIFWVTVP